ncbi:glutathione peroxidase [Pontibacter chitinilyticus]|uniref:glutathione peroxidase n=1 Tax=Pontibacter chitinilyticus TaxID=2674989 RepID=UPI003D266949
MTKKIPFLAQLVALVGVLAISVACHQPADKAASTTSENMATAANITDATRQQSDFYTFKMNSLEGQPVDFSKYKGKKVLVVNTASKCGFTPQYADLEKLHETYGKDVVILGFPANNFGEQEPGTNKEIATFCQKNYGVNFQMFEKISVKGDDKNPLYVWLQKNAPNHEEPTWNFCKYLIDENGKVVAFFPSKVKPMDDEILAAIQK